MRCRLSLGGNMSEIRKIRKPLMEKKRRARINDSLEVLKSIVLRNTFSIENGRVPAKLEKADILEMTVRHLKALHGGMVISSEVTSTTPEVDGSNARSYSDCYKTNNVKCFPMCSGDHKRKSKLKNPCLKVDKENVDPSLLEHPRDKNFADPKNPWRPWT